MNNRNKYLLTAIYCCCFQILFSQWGNPIHYTQENGLSTQAMFSSTIDSQGFVWFASEAGASRFNGKEFEHFRANEGISTNSLLFFAIDDKNKIWANSLTGQIYCYWNGKWIQNMNKFLPNLGKNTLNIYNNELIVFTGKKLYKYYLNYKNIIIFIELIDFSHMKYKNIEFIIKDNQFVFKINNELNFYNSITLKKEKAKNLTKKYVNINGKIMLLDNQLTLVKIPKNLYAHSIQYLNKKLYVASTQGFYIFDQINDSFFQLYNDFSLNIPCVDFELDKNENLWICSQFDGIYFYPKVIGKVNKFNELKGDVFLKTLPNPNGGFKHLTSFGKIIEPNSQNFKIEQNYNITSYDMQLYKGSYYTLTSNKLYINGKSYVDQAQWYKSLYIDSKLNEVYIGCGDRLIKARPKFELIYNFINPNRIYSLTKFNNDFLLGTDNGVFKYNNYKIDKFNLGNYTDLKNISQIKITKDSVLLFISRNLGVLLKSKNELILLKEQKELSSEPTCLFSPKEGVILIGTRNGLNYLTYSINPLKINSIKVY